MTTEAVCREWLNAMPGAATRKVTAKGFARIRHVPRIEVVAHGGELSAEAVSPSDVGGFLPQSMSVHSTQHRNQIERARNHYKGHENRQHHESCYQNLLHR
jgi:hypothetical protein